MSTGLNYYNYYYLFTRIKRLDRRHMIWVEYVLEAIRNEGNNIIVKVMRVILNFIQKIRRN